MSQKQEHNVNWKNLGLLGVVAIGSFLLGHLSTGNWQNRQFSRSCSANDKQRVLIIGDSITWGYSPEVDVAEKRLPYGERYTSVLRKKLDENIELVIEGLNGRTVAQPNRELLKHPYSHSTMDCIHILLHSHKPLDCVVVLLGLNDCKSIFKYTLETLKADMRKLIEIILKSEVWRCGAKPAKPKVVLLSPPPVREINAVNKEWDFTENSIALSQQLHIAYAEIAEEYKDTVTFVNPNKEWSVNTGTDSVHIDSKSNRRLGEGLADVIDRVLSAGVDNNKECVNFSNTKLTTNTVVFLFAKQISTKEVHLRKMNLFNGKFLGKLFETLR
ncbi:methylated-DNA--protein-cysteinemethyltransferase [Reticulomyxa filosa]|uniref:Methylated-DNA--protein-cysteinemethyltransferase n=1 Tax=Reticulomyxa filosa TaxID=46433 RepID=X6NUD5_RETFI|nr:methylated-DNA--protein-cysteinemethyltransferase [Reticulomyxa filosa]|eukprot:ETO28862.1 methylated-DNA--protein-cysteinemethyltransferase [Reticulomyxa filosa]